MGGSQSEADSQIVRGIEENVSRFANGLPVTVIRFIDRILPSFWPVPRLSHPRGLGSPLAEKNGGEGTEGEAEGAGGGGRKGEEWRKAREEACLGKQGRPRGREPEKRAGKKRKRVASLHRCRSRALPLERPHLLLVPRTRTVNRCTNVAPPSRRNTNESEINFNIDIERDTPRSIVNSYPHEHPLKIIFARSRSFFKQKGRIKEKGREGKRQKKKNKREQ